MAVDDIVGCPKRKQYRREEHRIRVEVLDMGGMVVAGTVQTCCYRWRGVVVGMGVEGVQEKKRRKKKKREKEEKTKQGLGLVLLLGFALLLFLLLLKGAYDADQEHPVLGKDGPPAVDPLPGASPRSEERET